MLDLRMSIAKTSPETIERLVHDVLSKHWETLRSDLVRKLTETQESSPDSAEKSSECELLDAAAGSIQHANSQSEILKLLLDESANFAARTCLFVLRGNTLGVWQARGFSDSESLKSLSIDSSQGLAGRAIRDKTPATAPASEFDRAFADVQGSPHDGIVLLVPLVAKDKVSAVLYADAGTDGGKPLNRAALQLLVRATGMHLEILSLRKAATAVESSTTQIPAYSETQAASPPSAPPPAVEAQPEPVETRAQAATAIPEAPLLTELPDAQQPVPEAQVSVSQASAQASEPAAGIPPAAAEAASPSHAEPDISTLSAADKQVHVKAKRFAKLLVEEIKLYNKAKVAEGQRKMDLFDRLREDFEKSKATYDKRYAKTIAGPADYFTRETIRILANNDVAVLGPNFPGKM